MENVKLLSPGERRIVIALTYGSLYKEIADDYDLSINTVKKHLKNAYKKLQVKSRKQAVKMFIEYEKNLKEKALN